MNGHAPGRAYLKVVGILLIIIGAIATLMGVLGVIGGGVIGVAGANAGDGAEGFGLLAGGVVIIGAIILLAGGVFNLVAGILGVKNCDKPEKSGSCFVLGVIMVVIQLISLVFGFLGGSDTLTASDIITKLAGFVLPALYLVGAYKNKQASM